MSIKEDIENFKSIYDTLDAYKVNTPEAQKAGIENVQIALEVAKSFLIVSKVVHGTVLMISNKVNNHG